MFDKGMHFKAIQRRALVLTSAVIALLAATPSLASPLNPNDFTSLGSLSGGAISVDTSALTLNGSAGGVLVHQSGGAPDIAVYVFNGGSMLGDVTVSGSNPLAILFQGSGTLAGSVNVSGGLPSEFAPNGTPNEQIPGYGVAGGANGGVGSNYYSGAGDGGGTGGGGAASDADYAETGGGGGGFGSKGQSLITAYHTAAGGLPYGDLTNAVEAGSGGGGGSKDRFAAATKTPPSGGGGAGGGALEIGALTDLVIAATADIEANGSRGGNYGSYGGGGGSGGGVLIHSYAVDILAGAIIAADGGNPGHLGVGGQGGCGGAGRVAILYNSSGSYTNDGTVEAMPGDDGTGALSGTACHPISTLNTISVLDSPSIGIAPTATTPLPATLPLLASGLGALGLFSRRRKRKGLAARGMA